MSHSGKMSCLSACFFALVVHVLAIVEFKNLWGLYNRYSCGVP